MCLLTPSLQSSAFQNSSRIPCVVVRCPAGNDLFAAAQEADSPLTYPLAECNNLPLSQGSSEDRDGSLTFALGAVWVRHH